MTGHRRHFDSFNIYPIVARFCVNIPKRLVYESKASVSTVQTLSPMPKCISSRERIHTLRSTASASVNSADTTRNAFEQRMCTNGRPTECIETIEIINFLPFPMHSPHPSPSAPAELAYILLGRHGFDANGFVRAVRPFEIGELVRKSFVKYVVEHLGSTGKFRGKYNCTCSPT